MKKRVLALTVLAVLILGSVFSEAYAVKVRLWFDSQGGGGPKRFGPLDTHQQHSAGTSEVDDHHAAPDAVRIHDARGGCG